MAIDTRPGVVFDMDDTLLLERDYVRSGFRHVARALQGVAVIPARALFHWLWTQFESGVRGDTFDRLIAACPKIQGRVTTAEIVTLYREHLPTVTLIPGVDVLMDRLYQDGIRLGLLSDGPLVCQRNKLCVLGLERWFQPALLSDAWGREFWKPHERGYAQFAEEWEFPANRLIYVGDNPTKDFVTPNRLGWTTIRLRLPGQLHEALEPSGSEYAPHHEVFDLPSLERLLIELGVFTLSQSDPKSLANTGSEMAEIPTAMKVPAAGENQDADALARHGFAPVGGDTGALPT